MKWQEIFTKEFFDALTMQNTMHLDLLCYPSWMLRKWDIDNVIKDRNMIADNAATQLAGFKYDDIGFRIKTEKSIRDKVERRYAEMCVSSLLCFNDFVGFRVQVDNFNDIGDFPEFLRVYDMSHGKLHNDGYYAVHAYYMPDDMTYPVEIQFWRKQDAEFHKWLHRYVYKNDGLGMYKDYCGTILRNDFEQGLIHTEAEFLSRMNLLGF